MIVTKAREWARITGDLEDAGASRVFLVGCGECATTARTGGEEEVKEMAARLETTGYEVTGWMVPDVTCHLNGARLEARKHRSEVDKADAVLVLACGAGTQTVADSVAKPVYPALESLFLGTIVRNGVFEERCQMCGECVLDKTAGICPVATCPKGLLNGPCGGVWEGMCDVLTNQECTHVRIQRRLAEQGRKRKGMLEPKDFSATRKPGRIDARHGVPGADSAAQACRQDETPLCEEGP